MGNNPAKDHYAGLSSNKDCPKCQLTKLRRADPMEFNLTLDIRMLHCDTCGASFYEISPHLWRYMDTT